MTKKHQKFQKSYNKAMYSRAAQLFTGYNWQTKKGLRDASITIKADWPLIYEIPKSTLEKLSPIEP